MGKPKLAGKTQENHTGMGMNAQEAAWFCFHWEYPMWELLTSGHPSRLRSRIDGDIPMLIFLLIEPWMTWQRAALDQYSDWRQLQPQQKQISGDRGHFAPCP